MVFGHYRRKEKCISHFGHEISRKETYMTYALIKMDLGKIRCGFNWPWRGLRAGSCEYGNGPSASKKPETSLPIQ
jgi:hypothetical protein